jgi:hypothetical protein
MDGDIGGHRSVNLHEYEYPIEQCDVPAVRRPALTEYRLFRRKCLEYLRGNAPTSVMNQVHNLAWHTAVFRTLNEARRLEPERAVNGAMWELIGHGYASLMTLGIRKLVDRDPRTDSVWNVIAQIEKRPELLHDESTSCATTGCRLIHKRPTRVTCAQTILSPIARLGSPPRALRRGALRSCCRMSLMRSPVSPPNANAWIPFAPRFS